MTASVREALAVDVESMVAIENSVTLYPWSKTQFEESLTNHHCSVLKTEDKIIGFVVSTLIVDEVELLNIAVLPESQGQGYGAQMMKWLIEHYRLQAKKIFLEVRVSNTAAIALYQNHRFNQAGVRKSYYPMDTGREDAWIMSHSYEK